MGADDKMRRNVVPYLEPGEQVYRVFRARQRLWDSQYSSSEYAKATLVVAETDRSILILKTSVWSTVRPNELTARLPRGVPVVVDEFRRDGWIDVQIGEHRLAVSPKLRPEIDALAQGS